MNDVDADVPAWMVRVLGPPPALPPRENDAERRLWIECTTRTLNDVYSWYSPRLTYLLRSRRMTVDELQRQYGDSAFFRIDVERQRVYRCGLP